MKFEVGQQVSIIDHVFEEEIEESINFKTHNRIVTIKCFFSGMDKWEHEGKGIYTLEEVNWTWDEEWLEEKTTVENRFEILDL